MKLLKTTLLLTKDRLKLPLKKMLKKHSITHTFFLFPDNTKNEVNKLFITKFFAKQQKPSMTDSAVSPL